MLGAGRDGENIELSQHYLAVLLFFSLNYLNSHFYIKENVLHSNIKIDTICSQIHKNFTHLFRLRCEMIIYNTDLLF